MSTRHVWLKGWRAVAVRAVVASLCWGFSFSDLLRRPDRLGLVIVAVQTFLFVDLTRPLFRLAKAADGLVTALAPAHSRPDES